ncbi:hypothetical protein CP10881SC42_0188 [Chlamydia avium]|uniref:Uncharacterized protein n=1 Tax=Chlamydia avium TaxID=1457141 RepID=A0ABN0MT07_9CHLA|nr:hypothetical protein CP10743SC13_0101 [Chlamydia psittaci 10_743_SC13]EPP38578.1 hypothetical protein CP10881SC42_0188 [Chlamydia avium]
MDILAFISDPTKDIFYYLSERIILREQERTVLFLILW